MRPPERIERINRCARLLPQNRVWSEIDFILEQFGLPTTNEWDDDSEDSQFNYVRRMLGWATDDEQIRELDEFLTGNVSIDPDDAPWEADHFRLFLTHVVREKAYATELKLRLSWWGVDAFVAHEDIEPAREWVDRIIVALHSCHALAALLQSGFRESDWCEQEVGVALGRQILVVPVRLDFNPYGFFGMLQAVPATNRDSGWVATEIVKILMTDKRTAADMTGAMVSALAGAASFNQANALSRTLAEAPGYVTVPQVERLRRAQRGNDQVSGAYDVDGALYRLEERLGVSRTAVPGYDDEPW